MKVGTDVSPRPVPGAAAATPGGLAPGDAVCGAAQPCRLAMLVRFAAALLCAACAVEGTVHQRPFMA